MKNTLFDYKNYKQYLTDLIKNKPGHGHGYRTVLAEAIGCRVAFISQILNKNAHLSLEQAEGVNELLGHTPEESDYFLLIVQFERAGTNALRERLKKQIEKVLEKRHVLKERVDIKQTLSLQDQTVY